MEKFDFFSEFETFKFINPKNLKDWETQVEMCTLRKKENQLNVKNIENNG